MTYDLIIIGAGAAGLFAAANAPADRKTLVLEKMDSPGKKLLMTGSGQCNLTNNEPIKNFLTRYGPNGKHLRPVLFPFSNLALMEFFEQHGLPLKVREDGKVFPASLKSSDVLELLLRLGWERGIAFSYGSAVTRIDCLSSESEEHGFSVQTAEGEFLSKRVLVATGGASYPQTGSDGAFFECLGHHGLELKLVERRPALVPIFVNDYPYSGLSGVTFPDCTIEVTHKGDGTAGGSTKAEGSLLLTHKGFSGPAILEISRYVSQGDRLTINYLPNLAYNTDTLRTELIQKATGDARQIVTILESITELPRSFLECICKLCHVTPNEKASRLSGREMGLLAKQITADSYEISDTGGFQTAMTTTGGVSLDEVDLRTMEAKRYPGLYFAGEVLDVDGDTGGYNLQFAFSSAMRAVTRTNCDHR